jgi:hypothetical protein
MSIRYNKIVPYKIPLFFFSFFFLYILWRDPLMVATKNNWEFQKSYQKEAGMVNL